MRQRNAFSPYQNENNLNPEEKEFINHLIDFLPNNLKKDDQDTIDYFIKNFDYLRDYAFKLDPKVVRNLNIKARSVFLAYHPTIRFQFHQKTELDKFLIEFPKQITNHSPESRTEYFRILPRLLFNEDKTEIYPQFRQKSYFQSIVRNIAFTPAYNFLIDLPHLVSDSLHSVLKQIGIPDMLVDLMKSIDQPEVNSEEALDQYDIDKKYSIDKNDFKYIEEDLCKYKKNILMKQAQNLFVEYVKSNMVVDIPETLLRNNAFEQIVQYAVIERRAETFQFLRNIMTYNTQLFKSSKWNDLYRIIYSHYDDYCNIILNTKPFDQCSQMCFYILCNIVVATKSLPDNFNEIYLRLTNEFFKTSKSAVDDTDACYHSHNSFLHICYVNLVFLLIDTHLFTIELIELVNLTQRITDFFSNMDPTEFYPQKMHCIELFTLIDSFISHYLLEPGDVPFTFDKVKWESCKEQINGIKKFLQTAYGEPLFNFKRKHSNSSSESCFIILLVLLVLIIPIKFLI